MPRWLARLWYRVFTPPTVEVEIVDNVLNRSSRFWTEARVTGVEVKVVKIGPDGLYDVLLIKRWPSGSVTMEVINGETITTKIPDGTVQADKVEGVNPDRFKVKGSKA